MLIRVCVSVECQAKSVSIILHALLPSLPPRLLPLHFFVTLWFSGALPYVAILKTFHIKMLKTRAGTRP